MLLHHFRSKYSLSNLKFDESFELTVVNKTESSLLANSYNYAIFTRIIGSLSKSLRLALIRLPEVNFSQNEALLMDVAILVPRAHDPSGLKYSACCPHFGAARAASRTKFMTEAMSMVKSSSYRYLTTLLLSKWRCDHRSCTCNLSNCN